MKRLKKYAHRLTMSLIGHLKKYRRSHELETLHQIRVDIKGIKAILGVINYSRKGFKAHKNFIPFREVFRRAGEIREPEVLVALLLRYQVEGIKDDQTGVNREESLTAAFESGIPQYIKMVKRRAPKLEILSRQVGHDDFKHYLQKERKLVKRRLHPGPNMRTIHKVRKNIKSIIYLSDIQGKLKSKEVKFYNELQQTIGALHDKQVLLGLLKDLNDETGKAQREIIDSETLLDKKEILRLVREYYS